MDTCVLANKRQNTTAAQALLTGVGDSRYVINKLTLSATMIANQEMEHIFCDCFVCILATECSGQAGWVYNIVSCVDVAKIDGDEFFFDR